MFAVFYCLSVHSQEKYTNNLIFYYKEYFITNKNFIKSEYCNVYNKQLQSGNCILMFVYIITQS